jgi:hypothetical protein
MEWVTFINQGIPVLGYVRFGVLMLVTVKITVFWNIVPSSLVDHYQYAGGVCYLCFKVEE